MIKRPSVSAEFRLKENPEYFSRDRVKQDSEKFQINGLINVQFVVSVILTFSQ